MNLTPSLGLSVSTTRRASTPVEKPEPAPAASHPRKPDGRCGPRVPVEQRARIYSFSILPADLAWLKGQPGGASKAIRRLVEAARTAEQSPTGLKDSRQEPRAGCGA